MTLLIMDIPDDPAHLPRWLEHHLVGLDLASVVAELTAVHGPSSRAGRPIGEILGAHRDAVLARGLAAAPRALVQTLLQNPKSLLELQDLVLTEGGAYWDQLPRTGEMDRLLAAGERRLADLWTTPTAAPTALEPSRPRVSFLRSPWFVSLATAAALLIAVSAWQKFTSGPPPEAGWGWSNTQRLAQARTGPEYLDALASAAEEWSNVRPEDRIALAKRIGEMRLGCTRLIDAEHEPLTDEAREELVGKCRRWAKQFDQHLQDLDAGAEVAKVRKDMDDTVKNLADALRKQADRLRSA